MRDLISRRQLTWGAGALTLMGAAGVRAQAPTPGLAGTGFQEIVLSVFNIDQIAGPMTALGEFERVPLPDAPPGQFAAWFTPPSCTRIEQAILRPKASAQGKGSLRLVKFHGAPQRVMRSSQRSWDTGGIFDIDVFTRDVDRAYRQLQTFGWTALGEPVDYSEASFSVRQVVAVGPSGLNLAMIQRYKPEVTGLPPFDLMSPVFNSTQMVSDYDRAAAFYHKTLGWPAALEFPIENAVEPGADVLGLPMPQARDAHRRIGIFHPQDTHEGSVELIENRSMRGRDFGPHCVAPNVGLLCLRFPVPDAQRYAAEIVARGGLLYASPSTFEIAPYGRVTLFSLRTPDGAILEFYQPA
jgi:predicted enzyme related to lactoylglutathione lyase